MNPLHAGRRTAVAATAAAVVVLGGCGPAKPPTVSERARPGPVFVLGFDGLTPDLVEQFEGAGLLPHFASLRERGAVGRVRSTVPMISPPAWTTVATGTVPGDHGVWGFWLPEGDDPRGRFVDASSRLAPAIWETLTEADRTVGIVNVPITCPPDPVNGFLIAGFPYPDGAPLTYPPELEAEIVERGYERDAWLGPPDPGDELAWLRAMRRKGEARREIALDLLFRRSPDFSFVVFTTPDRIQHHLWRFHDPAHPLYRADAPEELKQAVRDVYRWCDDILGEVLGRLPERGTLLVLADHGFGPAYAGISKAAVVSAAAAAGLPATESRALFGGDFYLAGADSAARARFAEALRELRAADGSPLVSAVHDTRRDPDVRGFGGDLGPDVVADEAEGYLFAPGGKTGPLSGPLPPKAFSGWHRPFGYFAAVGPPIEPGPVRDCGLADVPAIAMHVLGEPIPRRYQQNLPRTLFPNAYFVERPMTYAGSPTDGLLRPGERAAPAPDEELREQLEALGYVQ